MQQQQLQLWQQESQPHPCSHAKVCICLDHTLAHGQLIAQVPTHLRSDLEF